MCKAGLGVATVGANTIFAAITGISIAAAAVFNKIAVPQMVRHGYNARFATGVVAGSSVLGMLIPPSLLLILYGLLTDQSIGDLFLAGIGPGILLSVVFGLGIIATAVFAPRFIGNPTIPEDGALSGTEVLAQGLPIVLLIPFVLAGIYGGVVTPVAHGPS